MTSSLDWAGLAPALAAAVQAAAVMVQVYWDRRERGARTTQHDALGPETAGPGAPPAGVRITVVMAGPGHVSVSVRADGGVAGAGGLPVPPAKEHGPW
jgi:hypothetical protein